MVDAKAVKLGIAGLKKEQLPQGREVLKNGWFLALPFLVLIALMMMNYTPMKAGFYAIVSLLVILLIFDRKKLNWANITNALENGHAVRPASGKAKKKRQSRAKANRVQGKYMYRNTGQQEAKRAAEEGARIIEAKILAHMEGRSV